MNVLFNFIFTVVAAGSLLFGLWVFKRPDRVIRLQQRAYLIVNWRMEPVSMEKEIRNTRAMGLFLIVFTVITAALYFFFF